MSIIANCATNTGQARWMIRWMSCEVEDVGRLFENRGLSPIV
jgi:hypothetical protein